MTACALDAPGWTTRASASLLVRTLYEQTEAGPRRVFGDADVDAVAAAFGPAHLMLAAKAIELGNLGEGADAHAKAFQETPDLRFLMILALRLGRTLGELMDAIDTHELSLWREFNRQSPLATSAPTCWPQALPPWWRRRAPRSASRTCWCAGMPTMRSRPPRRAPTR